MKWPISFHWSDRGGELRFPRPELSPSSYSRGLSAQGSDVCLDSRGEQSLDLERFVDLYGNDAAAKSRKGQEQFNRWLLTGATLAGVLLLGSLLSRK
ncbi:bcl-2-like protein 1 isoform X2 [Mauremys mutica]|uniref:bcl-2-like protein 1 isoform X2 n=1 Tax=Mauremys mutica TaxID=74926 RepID=UPI001D163652|nr:bcl-2-like protein 1 isoform X2 [Mauremys mutica]